MLALGDLWLRVVIEARVCLPVCQIVDQLTPRTQCWASTGPGLPAGALLVVPESGSADLLGAGLALDEITEQLTAVDFSSSSFFRGTIGSRVHQGNQGPRPDHLPAPALSVLRVANGGWHNAQRAHPDAVDC